jgi:hypothetical protein
VNKEIVSESYDVFLSYNSQDRNAVESLAQWLRSEGLNVWFDKWELRPGLPWQEGMEKGIVKSKCTVVTVGSSGLGPWEVPEMRAALMDFVERKRPVIPVILPGVESIPELPLFLRAFTWVDFRAGLNNSESRNSLIWGITGEKPTHFQVSPEADDNRTEEHPSVFVFNTVEGTFLDLYQAVIRPALLELNLPHETISEVATESHSQLARILEEKVFEARIILFTLTNDSPWIPISLQSPPMPQTEVVTLLERQIPLPEVLAYSQVIRYTTNPSGLKKLHDNLISVLRAAFSDTRINEAENLFKYGYYDAAVSAAAQHLTDFLKNHALAVLGSDFFKKKPIRYYSLSSLISLLKKKKKLKTWLGTERLSYRKMYQVRNEAIHGDKRINKELCYWYIKEVRRILEANGQAQDS